MTARVSEGSPTLRVSVVIPAFNAGDDLERCLQAIKSSECPVMECIVVDDASTDRITSEIASRHNVCLIRMLEQSGPAIARNRGVQEAHGDIIFFTDADVLLHPDAIGHAVAAFQSDPEISAVFGSYDKQPAHPSFLSRYRNLYHQLFRGSYGRCNRSCIPTCYRKHDTIRTCI